MPNARRGEVWQIDFRLVPNVLPALVVGGGVADEDRVLVAAVHHTTAWRGSRYEVPMNAVGLDEDVFDAQSLYTVPAVKLIRRRAASFFGPTQGSRATREALAWFGLMIVQGVCSETIQHFFHKSCGLAASVLKGIATLRPLPADSYAAKIASSTARPSSA